MAIKDEVDRILKLLREKIREQGYTQLKVQESLDWGRTYISQLFRKQKSLRFDQVLQILNVIEIDPEEFFAEFYFLDGEIGQAQNGPDPEGSDQDEPVSELLLHEALLAGGQDGEEESESGLESHSLKNHRAMMNGLVRLLIDKEVINADELSAAVRACDDGKTPSP